MKTELQRAVDTIRAECARMGWAYEGMAEHLANAILALEPRATDAPGRSEPFRRDPFTEWPSIDGGIGWRHRMSIQDQINAAAAGSTLTIDAEECLVIPIEEIESAEAMMEARSISAETMTDDDQIIAFNLMTDQEVSPLGWLAVRDRENEIAERVKCLATDLNSAMVAAAETGLGITLRLEDTYLGSDGAAKTPQVAVTITKVL